MKNKLLIRLCLTFVTLCTLGGAVYFTLGGLNSHSTLRLACAVLPPYVFMNEHGELVGIEIDIFHAIAKRSGKIAEIRVLPFSGLMTALSNGEADMAAGSLNSTAERKRFVDFTMPHTFSALRVLVRNEQPYTSFQYMLRSMTKVIVAAEPDSLDILTLRRFLSITENKLQVLALSKQEALPALLQGKIQAYAVNYETAQFYQKQYPETLVMLPDSLSYEEHALALPLDRPKLLKEANDVIVELWRSGEMRNIVERHVNVFLIQ